MTEPFGDQFVDATDSITVDVAVKKGGGWYPSMIQLDFYENGGTILSDDARALAAMLVKAADSADAIDTAHDAWGSQTDAERARWRRERVKELDAKIAVLSDDSKPNV